MKKFTNIYEYKENDRYFYFVANSPLEIPNLPDPSKAKIFIEGIEIGNNDKFDFKYPWCCFVKKDSRIPEIKYRSTINVHTTQKYYASPIPSDIKILSPLYPFWNDVFRGPKRNRGGLRQKDITSIHFEHEFIQ